MTEDEIQTIWDENIQAVQDAKQSVLSTFREYTRVRAQVSAAARRRDPRYPVLSAQEQADVDRTRQLWDDSKEQLVEAQLAFKAGVPEA